MNDYNKNDMNDLRGVCLLPIMSKILMRILARRLRNWEEATGALGENQAGFRQGGLMADATQIFEGIQDAKAVRNMEKRNNEREERKQIATLLDREKHTQE